MFTLQMPSRLQLSLNSAVDLVVQQRPWGPAASALWESELERRAGPNNSWMIMTTS